MVERGPDELSSQHDGTAHAHTAPDGAGTDTRERGAAMAGGAADGAERAGGKRQGGEVAGIATHTAQRNPNELGNDHDGATHTGAATGSAGTYECEHGTTADAGGTDTHAHEACAHTCDGDQKGDAATAATKRAAATCTATVAARANRRRHSADRRLQRLPVRHFLRPRHPAVRSCRVPDFDFRPLATAMRARAISSEFFSIQSRFTDQHTTHNSSRVQGPPALLTHRDVR